ncbi:MAG: ExbD/TolR family protein [Pseudobdellovibrionaceae bacterium]
MAFQSSQSKAPAARRGINDINITPFVDVVLVLLVIFMVTAPMMMKDVIGLKLPKASVADAQTQGPLSISVTSAGQFLLFGELIDEASLRNKIAGELDKNRDVQAIISADGDAKHSDVVKALDILKSEGVENFAIQVEKQASE